MRLEKSEGASAKNGPSRHCPCGSGRKYKQCSLKGSFASGDGCGLRYDRGTEMQVAGRHSEVEVWFREALKPRPAHVETLVKLGNELESLGRPQQALEAYRRALALWPRFADLHLNIGAALYSLGRFEGAVASDRAGAARVPHDVGFHSNLAVALRACRRFEEAFRLVNCAPPSLVPRAGLEPARPLSGKAADFKSAVSTSFTTRAWGTVYRLRIESTK